MQRGNTSGTVQNYICTYTVLGALPFFDVLKRLRSPTVAVLMGSSVDQVDRGVLVDMDQHTGVRPDQSRYVQHPGGGDTSSTPIISAMAAVSCEHPTMTPLSMGW